MSLFERFEGKGNEEAFRDQFIKPLLIKLGFVNITNQHGSQELERILFFPSMTASGK